MKLCIVSAPKILLKSSPGACNIFHDMASHESPYAPVLFRERLSRIDELVTYGSGSGLLTLRFT